MNLDKVDIHIEFRCWMLIIWQWLVTCLIILAAIPGQGCEMREFCLPRIGRYQEAASIFMFLLKFPSLFSISTLVHAGFGPQNCHHSLTIIFSSDLKVICDWKSWNEKRILKNFVLWWLILEPNKPIKFQEDPKYLPFKLETPKQLRLSINTNSCLASC